MTIPCSDVSVTALFFIEPSPQQRVLPLPFMDVFTFSHRRSIPLQFSQPGIPRLNPYAGRRVDFIFEPLSALRKIVLSPAAYDHRPDAEVLLGIDM